MLNSKILVTTVNATVWLGQVTGRDPGDPNRQVALRVISLCLAQLSLVGVNF